MLTIIETFPLPVKYDWNNLVNFESRYGMIWCFLASLIIWLCRIALIHLPKTRSEVLMLPASFWRSPVFIVFLILSLPARSQKDNMLTRAICGRSLSAIRTIFIVKIQWLRLELWLSLKTFKKARWKCCSGKLQWYSHESYLSEISDFIQLKRAIHAYIVKVS